MFIKRNIESATVHFFVVGEGKRFGFAVTEGGVKIFISPTTYRQPEVVDETVEFLRTPAPMAVMPKEGDQIRLIWVTGKKGPFAIAWCLASDVKKQAEQKAAAKRNAALKLFGEEMVERFPQLLDHNISDLVLFAGMTANILTRSMPQNMLAAPSAPLRRGQSEKWVIVMRSKFSTNVLTLHYKSGPLRQRLQEKGVIFDEGVNIPVGTKEMVLFRIVESATALDTFIFTYNAPAREKTMVA